MYLMVVFSILVYDLVRFFLDEIIFWFRRRLFLRLYIEISFGRMKWLFFFILGRNLDVFVEEESEEEEVDEGYKREVSCNIIGYVLVLW